VVQEIQFKPECVGGQRGFALLRCQNKVTSGEMAVDRQTGIRDKCKSSYRIDEFLVEDQ
jgi:hypothetical protein